MKIKHAGRWSPIPRRAFVVIALLILWNDVAHFTIHDFDRQFDAEEAREIEEEQNAYRIHAAMRRTIARDKRARQISPTHQGLSLKAKYAALQTGVTLADTLALFQRQPDSRTNRERRHHEYAEYTWGKPDEPYVTVYFYDGKITDMAASGLKGWASPSITVGTLL